MPRDKTLLLFDVDGTLTVPRKRATEDMILILEEARKHCTIGIVGGSDFKKQLEQLGDDLLDRFDYVFSENGLQAFKDKEEFHRQSLVSYLGGDNVTRLAKFSIRMIADLDIPVQRGTFFELRNGMVNMSPIGRNCSQQERDEFEQYDKQHNVRAKMIEMLNAQFGDPKNSDGGKLAELQYSVGGQISFDVFPRGWDKTYCLQFVEKLGFEEIHFFGDKTYQGGNDYEIYEDKRTVGHTVKTYEDTIAILKDKFIPKN